MENNNQVLDYSTLLLSLILGLSINASYLSLFYSGIVSFSIFPLLCLGFAVYCLHQRYLMSDMAEGMPGLAVGCIILGALSYSVFMRVEYPQMGSNLIQTFIGIGIIFWMMIKVSKINKIALASKQD